jgi:PAB-dependent poly(A)-specific ribonuclease subunit 2
MPYYRDTLLSAWPSNIISDVGAPPVKLDPAFYAGLKQTDWGLYGRNTRGLRRNQAEDTRSALKSSDTMQAPKFLSEKARESAKSSGPSPTPEANEERLSKPVSNRELESLKPDAHTMYKNFEIKYSKFGVDDFDFG